MKTLSHALPATLFVALTFGITGCATYQYTRQKDSASVQGTLAGISASIDTIDRVDVPRINGAKNPVVYYVSPGNHTIGVSTFVDYDGSHTRQYHVEGIDTDFVANHIYRFDASSGDLSLWDETGGVENLNRGTWYFNDEEPLDNEPIAQVDIGGALHARPPLDRDEHGRHPDEHPTHSGGTPSHPSKPPSIPHNSRPKSGGGGNRGGGARSSGGGGKRK